MHRGSYASGRSYILLLKRKTRSAIHSIRNGNENVDTFGVRDRYHVVVNVKWMTPDCEKAHHNDHIADGDVGGHNKNGLVVLWQSVARSFRGTSVCFCVFMFTHFPHRRRNTLGNTIANPPVFWCIWYGIDLDGRLTSCLHRESKGKLYIPRHK